jgi:Flp pilus assembly protein TadD
MVGLLGCIGLIMKSPFRRHRAVISAIAIILILLFSIRSAERTKNWKNPQTLYEHDYPLSPDSPDLANALGSLYFDSGVYEKALIPYVRITELQPDTWLGWNNLGATYHRLGDMKKAESYFKIAVGTDDATPLPFRNLATLYQDTNYHKAVEVIQNGLTRYPENVDLWNLLIDAYKRSGDTIHEKEARRTLERILQTDTTYNTAKQGQNVLELHK